MLLAYSSEHLETDDFELRKSFFEERLISDVKTTFELKKPHCQKLSIEIH